MQTSCPECQTTFNITQQQLQAANGQVRCGHCYYVFVPDSQQPDFDTNELETDGIDINTFVEGFDTQANEPTPPPAPINNESFLNNRNPVIDDLVPPELRHHNDNKKSSPLLTMFWSLGILLLLVSSLAQLVYFNRIELATRAELRPHLLKLCELAKCDLPELRDVQRLELSSKNVYSHPNVDNALMITAVIVNQAAFAQQFPVLQISFTNLVGDIVMARRFTPAEYLNTGSGNIDDMEPGLPIQITLEVLDPGKNATAYEFNFI